MKKFITLLALLMTLSFTGCSADDDIVENPIETPIETPIVDTPGLTSGCYFIHFVNYDGRFHYTKKIYGDPTTYMLNYASPLPDEQLERWICPDEVQPTCDCYKYIKVVDTQNNFTFYYKIEYCNQDVQIFVPYIELGTPINRWICP